MAMWPPELLQTMWGSPSVLNAGRGGSTSLHWREWLARWDWSTQSPKLVFVGSGRNDLTLEICSAAVARNVIGLLDDVRAKWPQARVVWQTLTPGGYGLALKRDEIVAVNRLVRQAAATHGFEVLDLWSVVWTRCRGRETCPLFLPNDRYRYGPVHFGPNAYLLFAREAELKP